MKLSIIIPAYNEADGVTYTAAALHNVLADLRQTYELELIFVNDGSKDNTAVLLQEAFAADKDVTVVSHEVNRGLGAAIRTGFKYAKGDIVVTTDFEGTYDFRTIPELLKYMAKPDVDIVTASPYHRDGGVRGVPKYRLLFSYGASLLYRVLVDFRILTWTALFRAYRRPVVDNVEFGFAVLDADLDTAGRMSRIELQPGGIHLPVMQGSAYPVTKGIIPHPGNEQR